MRAVIVGLAICGLATAAHADRTERADQLFKKGKKLLADKKYAEACTAFEQSDRLDPGIGAKLNVAKCYQEWGKVATAWRWYSDAERMATGSNDERLQKIRALIAELDPSVPRLIVHLPADAVTDHLVVKLDGTELELATLGSEQRLDPGPHHVDTVIDGAKQTKMIPLERGTTEITLEVPVKTRPRGARAAAGGAAVVDDDPGRTRRLFGLGAAGAGTAAIGIAMIVTLRARGDYNHALSAHCSGARDMCDEIGQIDTRSARHRANISTGVTIFGAAAVAGGLYLYFTAPRGKGAERNEIALRLTPVVSGDGAGLVLGGGF